MYLHINKDCVIKDSDIIGIFPMKNIKNTKEFKDIFDNLKIVNLAVNNEKTFILTKENNEYIGYILKINIYTIKRRIQGRK